MMPTARVRAGTTGRLKAGSGTVMRMLVSEATGSERLARIAGRAQEAGVGSLRVVWYAREDSGGEHRHIGCRFTH